MAGSSTKRITAGNVTANDDGTVTIKQGRHVWHWDADRVARAQALAVLCFEAARWDCDCACCVVDGVIADAAAP